MEKRETRMTLKYVKSDNSDGYKGLFRNYCRSHGIRLKNIVPKNLYWNGVAKRMNIKIEERIRCTISNAKFPKSFRVK